jgi:hypothetical protein
MLIRGTVLEAIDSTGCRPVCHAANDDEQSGRTSREFA